MNLFWQDNSMASFPISLKVLKRLVIITAHHSNRNVFAPYAASMNTTHNLRILWLQKTKIKQKDNLITQILMS